MDKWKDLQVKIIDKLRSEYDFSLEEAEELAGFIIIECRNT